MDLYPRISIITPNLNGERFLEDTILSVISQKYPNLEYIIIDGGSRDGSINIINKYLDALTFFSSETDHGLYDAVNKGFQRSTGDIMGWINSDDLLHTRSLFTLAEIFSLGEKINWVQGYPTVIDETGRIVFHRPPVWSREFFYLQMYRRGSFIQQESTFWTRSLWERAGAYVASGYKFAGDFELWMRFFNYDQLCLTDTVLGSFRMRREGQLSRDFYQLYIEECDKVIAQNYELLSTLEKEKLKGLREHQPGIADHRALEHFIAKPFRVDFNLSKYQYELIRV